MSQGIVAGNYESEIVGDRFRLHRPPTLLARTSSVAPIGFTRLKSDGTSPFQTKDVRVENAYLFHVQLRPAAIDMLIDGKRKPATTTSAGTTFLYDLRSNVVAEIYSSFDNVRFYISQASLDELAFDQGIHRTGGLVSSRLGSPDRVMYGLASALLDHVERANERSALFIDHVALAFFAHVMSTYGNAVVSNDVKPGGLSPWQLRRVLDFIAAHLNGDPTIAELARECALSPGYFARAFRQTTGNTPHQWLVQKRIEKARTLLLGSALGLAEIAVRCGFTDQSHFTRVFTRVEGDSPGRWRRLHH
jgi:AraC family transcriptional regulator